MPFSFITHQSAPLSEGQSINSPEFNPFLHGTTTQALVMMSKTKWMLMPPLDLLEQHGLAPLSGELSKGGLNHAQARGQPSFGRLGAPQHAYSLECITTDYANKGEVPSTDLASWDLHSVTDEAPQTLYCNINLLLIHAARYRQLGGDVNKIKSDKIISELNAAINLFYLYLILGKYLVPNPEVAEMAKKGGLYSMNNPIDRAIQTHFSAEKLIEQLITLNLNLEGVYESKSGES
ncbi:hypothetical protein DIZ81_00870 [Legionella taurinensis]|uniref:Uncharacterized protein n=1 Tax=Legionella taurinensis TaxID=70611 RepID=A0AB38N8D0_9GAMM|nr:hypothetical protein [Legionella taurinensis]MDX1836572.1 hypothetical protein [Legionella taurinensis]PUT42966.1 hypothetical protein DB744_00875 [Legionella taurinensis]PUT45521.1 hypothetical protein DB746_00875 [Legionella taurinensis]PUT46904.1 hypothetical protein DB743_03125 [Legionella taurinensis]PUT49288.1 hypothetical protein DB745_00875 [Legionella taurinensis]